jgi:hypothetical protein
MNPLGDDEFLPSEGHFQEQVEARPPICQSSRPESNARIGSLAHLSGREVVFSGIDPG